MSDLPPNLLNYLNRRGYNTFDRPEESVRHRKPWSYKNYQESLKDVLEGEEVELLDVNSVEAALPVSTPTPVPVPPVIPPVVAPIAAVLGGAAVASVGASIYNTLSSDKEDESHKSPAITLPDHKYLGPGNSLDTGVIPVDDDDLDAFNHDKDYQKAKTTEEVREADREHILNTLDKAKQGDIHSIISNSGIAVKYGLESLTGVKYPSISGESVSVIMGAFKWEFDPDNWPDQRSNWKALNSSKKSYAIIQYNRARARRGLDPIPNPFDKKSDQKPYVIKPGSALAKKFPSFVQVETVTKPSVNTQIQPSNQPKSKHGPVIDVLSSNSDDSQSQPSSLPSEFSDDELRQLLKTPSFVKLLDQAVNTPSPISDQSNSPSSSTDKTDSASTQTSGAKRKADDANLTTPSSSKTKVTENPSSVKDENSDNMNLVGSGGDNMDVDPHHNVRQVGESGGKNYSGGLATEKGAIIPAVPRPYNFRMMDGFAHVRTCYSALSYGFATRILPHPGNANPPTLAGAFIVCGTTPLLEIPWDKLQMYLSPGVYASLPLGTYVKSVHCKVIQRNVRVAFETNASDTGLATLNQNKFSLMAVGLNTKNDIRVTNMRYNVSATDPMIPTDVVNSSYSDIDDALWGVDQNSTLFNNATSVPINHFSFNSTIHTKNYLVAWNTGNKVVTNYVNNPNGWYCLSQHVSKVPTTSIIDQVIINQDYYPSYSPIKNQLTFAEYLRGTLTIPNPLGGANVTANLDELNYNDHNIGKVLDKSTLSNISAAPNANPTESQVNVQTQRSLYDNLNTRNSLIEKGQYFKQIDADHNGKYVQPSIHVGIACVPKLTTTVSEVTTTQFTDVQSYFDVQLDMVIGFNYSHENTHQTAFNIPVNEIRMGATTISATNRPTINLPNRFGHQATV